MMQYQVIDADSADALVELVNEALEDGWTLQGGVAIAYSRDGGFASERYAQAMVKKG